MKKNIVNMKMNLMSKKMLKKIYIDGVTKQGNIDITLIDTNNNEHKVTINNQVQTEIEVDGQYGTWKYIINIYP